MSYAQYSTTDRWRWVDGCVHEHVGVTTSYRRDDTNACVVGLRREDSERQMLQVEYYKYWLSKGIDILILKAGY